MHGLPAVRQFFGAFFPGQFSAAAMRVWLGERLFKSLELSGSRRLVRPSEGECKRVGGFQVKRVTEGWEGERRLPGRRVGFAAG